MNQLLYNIASGNIHETSTCKENNFLVKLFAHIISVHNWIMVHAYKINTEFVCAALLAVIKVLNH